MKLEKNDLWISFFFHRKWSFVEQKSLDFHDFLYFKNLNMQYKPNQKIWIGRQYEPTSHFMFVATLMHKHGHKKEQLHRPSIGMPDHNLPNRLATHNLIRSKAVSKDCFEAEYRVENKEWIYFGEWRIANHNSFLQQTSCKESVKLVIRSVETRIMLFTYHTFVIYIMLFTSLPFCVQISPHAH